ncbi:MAG: hypothetical protein K9G30_00195 [Parvibaculum sp.]|nr:hypothetical protein [Parvibaculum sp.]
MTGPIKKTDDARQGETGNGVRYVFAISTAAAVVVLFAIAYAFFGAPEMGLDDAQVGTSDANPPHAAPADTPDTPSPRP